ncbi:MAG: glycosyltransferase [Thermoleophilia bacterium]|nr:glycosyltransferase [Thermoleophilia bacterium]
MKIAWFTPFSPESAIGRLSREIVEELAPHADVTLWVDAESTGLLDTTVPVVHYTRWNFPGERLAPDTVCVYHLGNSAANHETIMGIARLMPGVVVLHDSTQHHAYVDLARHRLTEYFRMVERWHGPRVAEHLTASVKASPTGYPPAEDCDRYPLLGEAVRGALGVVVHCQAQIDRLEGEWGGPVWRLWLPSTDVRLPPSPPRAITPGDRLRLLSLGWVGEPKQIHTVIEVLGSDPALARRVTYRVAGPIDLRSTYGERLVSLVAEHHLEHTVEFTGWVDHDALHAALDWADVHVNLRFPCTEGGSLSLLQQLATARAVLAGRRGIFGEIPEDAAIRPVDFTPEAVADALRGILSAPESLAGIGRRGRAWAEGQTVERYARDILDVVGQVNDWRVMSVAIDRLGTALGELGARPDLPVCDEALAQLERFAGPRAGTG